MQFNNLRNTGMAEYECLYVYTNINTLLIDVSGTSETTATVLPLWSLRLRVSKAPVEPVSDSTSSTEGRSDRSEGVVSSGSW